MGWTQDYSRQILSFLDPRWLLLSLLNDKFVTESLKCIYTTYLEQYITYPAGAHD